MDLMGSHRMINHSDSESIGSRIESSSGFGDESSSALSHEVLPWHGQSVVAGQPAEGPHVFLADSASNADSSVQESGFEESSVQSSALDNQGSPPLCERDGCVMQISDLCPDILRLRPHYLCSRCFGSSQQGHLGGSSRRWMCPRCRNDTCLQCYPKEPTAEQPALTATRPGARLESGGKDGEEEKEEPEVAEEAALKLSKGSAQHLPGSCKPCLYVVTPAGCSLGVNCEFCHEPACRRKRRARPSKTTRMQCKQLVAMLDSAYGDDDSQVVQAAETLAADSAYMRSILAAKGRQHPVQAQKAPTGSDQGAQGGATQSREPQPPALREPQGPPAQSSAQRRDSPDPHDASPVGAPSARRA
mmetsp:Transcript_61736/g.172432  ORF Transcript_61736/g.172432 Transcript_61736/m.172432 type:complete len:360 (-) Transcript_61736:23-1102(-)